jgi:hypothetical protein
MLVLKPLYKKIICNWLNDKIISKQNNPGR